MSKETDEGITKIAVTGFKSLAEECVIDIRPLTILAGANSSGKSSIMQPLLMLKQTLEAPYDPGPLLLHGPNVQFTLAEQFFSKLIGEERVDRFQIRIDTRESGPIFSTTTTFKKGQSGIEIAEMTRERKLEVGQPLDLTPKSFTLYPEMPTEEVKSLADQDPSLKDLDVVRRLGCFLFLQSQDGRAGFEITMITKFHIVNSIHLPGLRGNPERTYKPASTGPQYPGTFENYTASIIREWQETRDERVKTLADALYALGLTGQIATKKINDTRIEVRVSLFPHRRTGETDMVSIADVGFGVSQVLPVLVA